jgi:hypothetical protein
MRHMTQYVLTNDMYLVTHFLATVLTYTTC